MGKYSRANLLDDELSVIGHSDFFSKMIHKMNKSSTILMTIDVPLNLYLRAEVFCEDIEELSEMAFDQNVLMNLLYNDFLLFAKKKPDPAAIFKMLTSLDQNTGKNTKIEKSGESVYRLIREDKEVHMKTLHLKFRRKFALRGEILLADMEEVQPNHGYTLEKVLELLYIDFIEQFRKGNNSQAVNNILRLLEE